MINSPHFLFLLVWLALPQSAAFEAASIKPTQAPIGSPSGIATTTGRMRGSNVTLRRCIRGAYNLPETLILGGPKWIDEERYDIEATTAGPAGDHEISLMLQTLLADRFQLKFHRETRDMPGYALVAAKGGPKLTRSANETSARNSASRGKLESRASTMANFAQKLSEALKSPVSDFTQLDGKFDFTLSWDPQDSSSKEPFGPSIFTALQEQLGLKLESRKVPVEVIVVDAASKPSLN